MSDPIESAAPSGPHPEAPGPRHPDEAGELDGELDQARAVIDAIRLPLLLLTTGLRVAWANRCFLERFGLSTEDCVGAPLTEIGHGLWDVAPLSAALHEAAEGSQGFDGLEISILPGGEPRRVVAHAWPLARTRNGNRRLLVMGLEDVTAHRLAEQALRDADRSKDEFLAVLAHELRNPLAPILNAVEMMRLTAGLPDIAVRAREMIDRQVRQLARIVEDLSDVSAIVQRKVRLRLEPVPVAEVLQTAADACRNSSSASRHELLVSTPPAPLLIDADPVRITQVLVNLLDNAMKYTAPGGRIWLIASRVDRACGAAPRAMAEIRVRDTGAGISKEFLPRVFDQFTQGEPAGTQGYAGLGLGLALVRSLVELHGGTVEARSAGPGLGSEFVLLLPLHAGPMEAEPSASPTVTRRRRVLVVDDNHDQAESVVQLLQLLGHEARKAHDGPSALALAGEFEPEIALVDIGLPGMSGCDVARELRGRPGTRNALLVAQTGWGMEEDRRRTEEAGFDEHLVKPVSLSQLRRILDRANRGDG